jgi:hypothetical protein
MIQHGIARSMAGIFIVKIHPGFDERNRVFTPGLSQLRSFG